MKKLLINIFKPLFLLSSLLFVVSIIVPFISPQLSGYIALPGFLFLWLFLLHIVWFIVWFSLNRKMMVLSVLVLLLGSYNAYYYFSLIPSFNFGTNEHQLSIMSWNVKNFDLYNWNENTRIKASMIDVIKEQNPDILVLQEFYTDKSTAFNTLAELVKLYPYYQFRKTLVLNNSKYWGVATFSKHPLKNKKFIRFPNSRHNQALIIDVIVGADTFSIYNVHLQSINLDEHDYEGLETATQGNFNHLTYQTLIQKLAIASQKRAPQADTIQHHLAASKHPVILAGDFNDSPNSYVYHTLSDGLNDAFLNAGWGIGKTYDGPIPALRIDFILTSQSLTANQFDVIKTQGLSDHYPIVARYSLAD